MAERFILDQSKGNNFAYIFALVIFPWLLEMEQYSRKKRSGDFTENSEIVSLHLRFLDFCEENILLLIPIIIELAVLQLMKYDTLHIEDLAILNLVHQVHERPLRNIHQEIAKKNRLLLL